ncbi:protein translocase subunit SecDF [Thermosulfurimonas dismutans]|uniref:Multifunctional fusion protein n=1 Tax=Thermosulfurimonas dismutans TaxID=999894 RepID=A0A179D3V7_9BACT|nr:protein translocase subunit SecDF [Thermosulfurimonas dismutans]OAQ20726.1 Protein-export membrane protein SecD [Thermosulfurimonas dismutans]
MPRYLKWKVLLVAILTLVSVILVLPSFYQNLPSWFKKYVYGARLKLGLDLQGGMHVVLKVDVDKAIHNALNASVQDLREALGKHGIKVVIKEAPEGFVLSFGNEKDFARAKDLIDREYPELKILEERPGKYPEIKVALSAERAQFIREHAVEQSLEVIRNRIDQFGVTEPVIVRQGKDKIVVQLPGVKDPERALKLIGQTAQLEFKLVDEEAMQKIDFYYRLIDQALKDGRLKPNYTREDLNRILRSYLPPGDEIYFWVTRDRDTGRTIKRLIILHRRALLTGDMVKTAHVRIGGPYNEPYVSLTLTSRGARIFERITGENVGRRLAIVLDNVVRSAPVIRERIPGGQAQISGGFTYEEASDLAIVLRAGALPAPVEVIQNITVGPTLGRDSIHKGLLSGVIGGVAVLVFMIIYYRFSGFVADVALVLNVLFLLAVLSLFRATLTLPGIAGIILTMGMGVDSNVLIFERMREELLLGRPPRAAINAGYDRAFWTIVDAHVTTLITALALFLFGTGPIKGFAVTLSAGIVINLFTAIFATRIVYDALIAKGKTPRINFLQIIGKPKINFMAARRFCFALSGALVALGLLAFVQISRGVANLGVDFGGGVLAYYKAEKAFKLDAIRKVLSETGLKGIQLQDVKNENLLLVRVREKTETVGKTEKLISKVLSEKFPELKFKLIGKEEIGSAISKELKRKAIIAILISLVGFILYLAFRFKISFGVAAAVATFHDVLAVLGIFYLLNREISLLLVTALLTLAGYSLTDTVVIFDRIRENIRKLGERTPFSEIINRSVNEMLARTIITTLTTMLVILSILIFGGVVLRDFALALFLGVIVGTYSSVFVASPIVYLWHKGKTPKLGG